MECDICREQFDAEKHVPKVLSSCGHTFCELCLMRLWSHGIIVCPECRIASRIQNVKDMPQTNYALMKIHVQIDENKNAKTLIEKYQHYDVGKISRVREEILRPDGQTLKLYAIYDDMELIYEEEGKSSNQMSMRKYSFCPDSMIPSLIANEDSRRMLFLLRKFTCCRHRHSCAESFIRKLYRNAGMYCLFRFPIAAVMGRVLKGDSYASSESEGAEISWLVSFILESSLILLGTAIGSWSCYYNYLFEELV